MGFLDNYLTVNEKVKLAHERFPNCKIIANIIEHDLTVGYALVQADFYRDQADPLPAFRDFAYGNVAFYPNNMKRWFIEDTTSSAIGRVISVALATSEKPNRETMEQISEESVTLDGETNLCIPQLNESTSDQLTLTQLWCGNVHESMREKSESPPTDLYFARGFHGGKFNVSFKRDRKSTRLNSSHRT